MNQYSTDTIWVGMDVDQDSITAAILFGVSPGFFLPDTGCIARAPCG